VSMRQKTCIEHSSFGSSALTYISKKKVSEKTAKIAHSVLFPGFVKGGELLHDRLLPLPT
jgi:hypothetical protein